LGLGPDEAYFFTIEARELKAEEAAVWDPVTFSGGEPYDLQGGQFDRVAGSLSYHLPQPPRVLVRLGIPGSVLLKTLVDWEPRVGGTVTEYWNGRDEDNLINLWERNFATLITYYTLPASSVITYGNRDYDYRFYKGSINMPRPAKPARAYTNARQISPHLPGRG
jgi:hypothetical protein